jgi:hypothetical protein
MADLGRAPGGRPMTVLWMVIALLVVGGFLAWLNIASEPTAVVVVDDGNETGVNGDAAAGEFAVVQRDTLAEALPRFVGQQVRVQGVPATSRLGPAIFWGELGDMARQRPVLVRMDEDVAAAAQVEAGTEYTITGQVLQISDELVESWGEAGEFSGEGEQMQATFADYYIQASGVRPSPAARRQQGS